MAGAGPRARKTPGRAALIRPAAAAILSLLLTAREAHAADPWSLARTPVGLSHTFLHWDETEPLAPSWVRLNLHWGYWQPTPEPDTTLWAWVNDETFHIEGILSRGYVPLTVVRTGTVWANRGTGEFPYSGPSYPPSDLTDTWDPADGYSASYHRFIYTLVRHFNGDGERRLPLLAIENEANSVAWWRGLQADDTHAEAAQQYLRLLATAYHAAKSADPGILIADSGFASLAWGAVMVKEMMDRGAPADSTLALARLYNARNFHVSWGWPYYWESYAQLQQDFDVEWDHVIQEAQVRMTDILAGLRPSDRYAAPEANVDLLNLHFYENYWMLEPVLDWARGKMGGTLPPVFTDEIGTNAVATPPSGGTAGGRAVPNWEAQFGAFGACGYDDSEGPGNELIEKTVTALALGIAPVAWLIVDGTGDLRYSDKLEMALFADDPAAGYPITGHRPLYYACQFLSQHLGAGGGHRHAARDTCLAAPVYRYVFADAASGAPDLEVLWWDDGSWREAGLAARGGRTVRLPAPAGAEAARVHRDYLFPESHERHALAPGARLEIAVTEHPVIVRWEGTLAPSALPAGCGEDRGDSPSAPGREYGWQGLRVSPNPARGSTEIRFHLARRARVELTVHDVRGVRVATLFEQTAGPGWHAAAWPAAGDGGVAPGLYFVRAEIREEGGGSSCGPRAAPARDSTKVLFTP